MKEGLFNMLPVGANVGFTITCFVFAELSVMLVAGGGATAINDQGLPTGRAAASGGSDNSTAASGATAGPTGKPNHAQYLP